MNAHDEPALRAENQRVVVRLPNPAGDVVLATPALRAIRRAFPAAKVTWAGRPAALALLDGLSDRDDVLPVWGRLDRGVLAPRRLGRAMKRLGPDVVVVMPGSWSSALAARASGAAARVGYARRGRGAILTRGLEVEREGGRPLPLPMRAYYLALARAVGGDDDGLPPRLVVTSEGEVRARSRLARDGAAGSAYFAVSPGAAFGPSKVYPPRLLSDVVRRVRAATGLLPLVLCGPGEEALAAETVALVGAPALSTHDEVARWPEAKALLQGAALLLTPDAGPRHVAAALGTPVVSILGPTDPRWSAGDEALVTVLRKEGLPCLSCHERICPIAGHPCMETLDPAEVAAACLARIALSPRTAR